MHVRARTTCTTCIGFACNFVSILSLLRKTIIQIFSLLSRKYSQNLPACTFVHVHHVHYVHRICTKLCQKLQIQKARLRFLQNCRYRKRPPPSLRITGASSIDWKDKIRSFSALESDLLNSAIINRQSLVKYLSSEVKDNNLPITPLSDKDSKAMRDHFSKKLTIYIIIIKIYIKICLQCTV